MREKAIIITQDVLNCWKIQRNLTHYSILQMSNGKYIEICESNLKKEYKLKIFIKNFNNYEKENSMEHYYEFINGPSIYE